MEQLPLRYPIHRRRRQQLYCFPSSAGGRRDAAHLAHALWQDRTAELRNNGAGTRANPTKTTGQPRPFSAQVTFRIEALGESFDQRNSRL